MTELYHCFSKRCDYRIDQRDKLASHLMSVHGWTFEQARKKANKTQRIIKQPRKAVHNVND